MIIDKWQMNYRGYHSLDCIPPCSMYSVLLEHDLIEDPFDETNELSLIDYSRYGVEFTSTFTVSESDYARDYLYLVFNGIDTICDIYLNGEYLAHTENMHRRYEYDIKSIANLGSNTLLLRISSPIEYFERKNAEHYLWVHKETISGASHLRKALCMSGWDWAPTLPDMGIFREVELLSYDGDRFSNIIISQRHARGEVSLTFDVSTHHSRGLEVYAEIDGQRALILDKDTEIKVSNPRLWWARGYGDQYLYDITFTMEKDGVVIDSVTKRIGLRTLTISQEADEDGREFCFVLNGVKIFMMGANYIPQDSLYARVNYDTTKRHIEDFVFANFNCIRVWGGGYYPDDYFYDLCDEYGLVVWQDFMMACSNIWLNDAMREELTQEAIYNFSRISHHASLGIVCGNNEVEDMIYCSPNMKTDDIEEVKADYIEFYERILPSISARYLPDTYYHSSSPTTEGSFIDPQAKNIGDVHYWDVWHGSIPFENYRKYNFRFCSEYGFESFPNIKTIRSFCSDGELNPFSYVMEHHQKCLSGNGKILSYLSATYLYPHDFESLVYASQLLQAEAIRCGVEHFRRTRGYCMGSIYWQVNDCWPVASWSSVDYYGRYKALHYTARRFYAPISQGIFVDEDDLTLNVSNETMEDRLVTLRWFIRDSANVVVNSGETVVTVPALTSLDAMHIDIGDYDKYEHYFTSDLIVDGERLSRRTELFVKPKHYHFIKPNIEVRAEDIENGVRLFLHSDVYAKWVEIDFIHYDLILSDNYIDLTDDTSYTVDIITNLSAENVLKDIKLRSVYDVR